MYIFCVKSQLIVFLTFELRMILIHFHDRRTCFIFVLGIINKIKSNKHFSMYVCKRKIIRIFTFTEQIPVYNNDYLYLYLFMINIKNNRNIYEK